MAKKIDMTGWIMSEHGVPDSRITIIEEDINYKKEHNINNTKSYWKCQCICGNIFTGQGVDIRRGAIKSCGCLSHGSNKIDMTGWKMWEHGVPESQLTIIEKDEIKSKEKKRVYWKYQCTCGNYGSSVGTDIRSGKTLSCGCRSIVQSRKRMLDLTGKIFGRLTVIKPGKNINSTGRMTWICQCDCGNIIETTTNQLTTGNTSSCGCLKNELLADRRKLKIEPGQVFNYLTVIRELDKDERKDHRCSYLCQCKCGSKINVLGTYLVNNKVMSCGCLKSKGEYLIAQLLTKNNIPFIKQKTYDGLYSAKGGLLKYDFLINNQFLLEYDGEQHFQDTTLCKDTLEERQDNDMRKNEYAKSHNIPMKRIPYWDYDKITLENIMDDTYLIN